MDQKDIQDKFCQQHSYQIIAVDLKHDKTQNEKFLCAKCLILRLQGQQVVLLSELIQMISEMKAHQKQQSIENNQAQLDFMNKLQHSLKECNQNIQETFEKAHNKIEHQIDNNNKDIQSQQDCQDEIDLDKDIEALSKCYKGNKEYDLPQGFSDIEIIEQFVEGVYDQIGSISNVNQYSKILESIKNVKTQFSIDTSTDNDSIEKHICEQHSLEIAMVNIEFDHKGRNRLACLKCIQEFPSKYTTLEEADQNWIKFKCQSKQLMQKYNKEREQKFNQAIKFITNMRDKYQETLTKIIQELQNNKIITEDQLSPFPLYSEDIYQLDRDQLIEILEVLSQKDLYRSLKLKLQQQDQLDSIFYQKLKEELENLIKFDLFIKEQIMMIESNFQVLLILNENGNDENPNNINIRQFLENNSILKSYMSIFEDSFELHSKLQRQIDNLLKNQEISELLNKNKREQDQISDFYQVFTKQYSQFEIFSNKLKDLLQVYQNDKLLSQLQQENQQIQEKLKSQINVQNQLKEELQRQKNDDNNKIQNQVLALQKLNEDIKMLESNLKLKDESEKQLKLKLEQELTKLEQLKQNLNEQEQKNNSQIALLNQTITDLNQQIKNNQTTQQQQDQKLNSLQQQFNNQQQQYNKLQLEHNNILKDIKAQSSILQNVQYQKIIQTIEEKSKQVVKCTILVYCGNKDGLNHTQFWNRVYGRRNLLMVFKSNTNYICGSFSPCQWLQHLGNYVIDDTLQSFLFSQNHNQIYPLKAANKANAIYCNSAYGPTFGSGHDLYVHANFNGVTTNLGSAYQCDQYGSITGSTHLFGQSSVQIVECEIFEVVFK